MEETPDIEELRREARALPPYELFKAIESAEAGSAWEDVCRSERERRNNVPGTRFRI